MTDQSKNESDPEQATAPSPDNVVKVDFTHDQDKTNLAKYAKHMSKKSIQGDVELQIYYIEEAGVVGLEFSQPVKEFRMDLPGTEALVSALAAVLVRAKGDKPS